MTFLPKELLVRIGASVTGFQRDAGKVTSAINRIGREAKDLTLAFGTVTAGSAAAIVGLGKMAQAGGRVINVQEAFNRVAGDGASAIGVLRKASRGLINDYDLMVGFNRAIALGVAKSADEFATLITVSDRLSRSLGIEGGAAAAMERLNLGIGRKSRLILDDLGIIVSATEANRRYAESIGKGVEALSEAEKGEAFRLEALRQAEETVEKMGDSSLTTADGYTQLTTSVDNVTAAFTRMVAKSVEVGGFFATLRDAAQGAQIMLDAMAAGVSPEGLGVLESISAITDLRGAVARLAEENETLAALRRGETDGATILGIPGMIDPQEMKDQVAIVEALQRRVTALAQTSRDVADGPPLLPPPGPSVEVLEILQETDAKLRVISDQAAMFGNRFDAAKARVDVLKDAVVSLLEEGLRPSSQTVQDMVARLNAAQGLNISEMSRGLLDPSRVSTPIVDWSKELRTTMIDNFSLASIWMKHFGDETKRQRDRIVESYEAITFAGVDLAHGIGNAFADAALNGMEAWTRLRDHVIAMLAQIAARFAIFQLLSHFFPGSSVTTAFGLSSGFLTQVPGRAFGGQVVSGRAYLVGERGPELFVPGGSGHVVSNEGLRGSGVVHLHLPPSGDPRLASRDRDFLHQLSHGLRELGIEVKTS